MTLQAYPVLLAILPSAQSDPGRARAPWEANTDATSACLSWRGTLDDLCRRQAEDALGETIYLDFPLHTRTAVVVAHLLLEQGQITEGELEAKMREVRARLRRA